MIESMKTLQILIRTMSVARTRARDGRSLHKSYLPCKRESCLSLFVGRLFKGLIKNV